MQWLRPQAVLAEDLGSAPMSGGAQQPTTPAPGKSDALDWSQWALHLGAHTQNYVQKF